MPAVHKQAPAGVGWGESGNLCKPSALLSGRNHLLNCTLMMPQARTRRCWGAGSPWPQQAAGRGSRVGTPACAREPASLALCSGRRRALHTPGVCGKRGSKFGLSLCVEQATQKETPAQEENAAAPEFIEQESQTEALAPGTAVKPFCMRSLRRGLGRAVCWEGHWPREWPPGNTYISQELWHIWRRQRAPQAQIKHSTTVWMVSALRSCPCCSRGLHILPMR